MKQLIYILFFFSVQNSVAQAVPKPFRLRTDWLLNLPNKGNENYYINEIESRKPVFSWEVDPALSSIAAYQILVAKSKLGNTKNDPPIWDSKKTTGNQLHATYEGPTLEPGIDYYWTVKIWDQKGSASSFSNPFVFKLRKNLEKDSVSHYPLVKDIQKPLYRRFHNDQYFMDFGKDGYAQLELEIEAEIEDSVTVEVGELSEDQKSVTPIKNGNIRYLKLRIPVSKGLKTYPIQWPANEKRDKAKAILMPQETGQVYPFRYVGVQPDKKTTRLTGATRHLVHYPFNESASYFESSDTLLNQVWELCKYSMKATSFCGFYVDGDRERIPYEGDAIINQLSQYAVDAEYSMARRTMAYLLYHPTWPTEWNLQNPILAWNDYAYTGETSFIKKYESMLKLKTLSALADSTGLISTTTGKQTPAFLRAINYKTFDLKDVLRDIVDWPRNGEIGNEKEYGGETDGYEFNDYNAVVNAFYYRSLVLMGKMMDAVGKKEEAEDYVRKAAQVYTAYQTMFTDSQTGLVKDGNTSKHHSLHGNMFALCFGLVQDQNKKAVLDFIKSRKMACSVYGSQFLLEALYENGAADYALELMTSTAQRSWYNMMKVGSTITLEAWDKIYKPNTDWNHAWGAAPANIIVRHLMGVQPLEAGFNKIRIRPQVGNLKYAQLKTPTIKGAVVVAYSKSEKSHTWKLELPGGTTTRLELPYNEGYGQFWLDGKKLSMEVLPDGWLLEHLKPGKHVIEIKR